MSTSVCVSVFFVRDDISGTTCAIFTKFFVYAVYGHGLIHRQRHCDALCASSFVDDIIFFL